MEIDQQTWNWLEWLGFDSQILMRKEDRGLEYVLTFAFGEQIIRGPGFKDILKRLGLKKNVEA